MKIKLITAPAAEPITTAEAKSHMHISGSDDDTYIDTLISGARQELEARSRRSFVNTTWEIAVDGVPCDDYIVLPYAPLSSVTSVTWYDEDGTGTALSSSTDFHADTYSIPGRVVLKRDATWPWDTDLRTANSIVVRYVAGYGANAAAVPTGIKNAVKQLVKATYDDDDEARAAAFRLIQPFRVMML